MRRDEVNELIDDLVGDDGSRRFLFGDPVDQIFVGLAASPTHAVGDY